MASIVFPTLQKAFCGLINTERQDLLPGVDVANGTIPTPAPAPLPTDFSSLLTFLFSLSALGEWLKLFLIGGLIESARRFFFMGYDKACNSFFITATFENGDDSYDWMMVWLSKQSSWSEARELQISTRTFGLNSSAILVPGEEEDTGTFVKGNRQLSYLPTISTSHSFFYKKRWVTVTRSLENTGYYSRPEERLTIRIMTRHHVFLNMLLLEAKKEYLAAQENSISIYVSDSSRSGDWRHIATRPKRPLHSIVLDPGIKNLLIDDARDFLGSKSWYSARGIPFRRGYLLYGAPGSGKTSIIHSLAGELGLDVYIVSLSRAGMDDSVLSELISELPDKCIALMEDIDAAFSQTVNRDEAEDEKVPHGPSAYGKPKQSTSRVSLSGLLNALDGVAAQEGRILFATTNKYDSLDPALCRPGRMDIHIEFKLASKYQAHELYQRFYLPDHEAEKDADVSEKESDSKSAESTPLVDLDKILDASIVPSCASTPPTVTMEKAAIRGFSHQERAPKLSRAQVMQLARHFSEAIPERKLSMASLQGYLMAYKIRPFDAVQDISVWVETELSKVPTEVKTDNS